MTERWRVGEAVARGGCAGGRCWRGWGGLASAALLAACGATESDTDAGHGSISGRRGDHGGEE